MQVISHLYSLFTLTLISRVRFSSVSQALYTNECAAVLSMKVYTVCPNHNLFYTHRVNFVIY